MRQSLLASFNTIYLLNLHGSNRRTEAVPDGEQDENVFDIIQGVSILLCVKERDNLASAKVYYADMWGLREEKYSILSESMSKPQRGVHYNPQLHTTFLAPQAADDSGEYEIGWKNYGHLSNQFNWRCYCAR